MPATAQIIIRPVFFAFLLICSLLAKSASAEQTTATLQLSDSGSEVLDLRARLAWQRCVYGMQWQNQRCEGKAQRLSYGQAQKLAQAQHKSDGLRWRLPRTAELRRLYQSAESSQAAELFPNTPPDWHWSGTVSVNASPVNIYSYDNTGPAKSRLSAQQAWAVDWGSGSASGEMGRSNALLVRLVRPLKADELPPAAQAAQ